MNHDIIDNRKEKLVDHINRILSSTESAWRQVHMCNAVRLNRLKWLYGALCCAFHLTKEAAFGRVQP